ncbi:hypothetical protein HK405_002580 [Cladochytrium tenue]|nr:hypothetical protein HK405_002580 [Cladochytrium tenue]
MEKYSRWRDPGTGIAPFLPPRRLRNPGEETALRAANTAVKSTLGPLLGVAKLIVAAALAAVGVLLLRADVLLVNYALRRAWRRVISLVFGRVTLFLLGFYWIKHTDVSLKRGLRNQEDTRRNKERRVIRDGDVIVANHSSYVDVIYLQTMFSPVFVHVSEHGKVRRVGFAEALMNVGEYPDLADGTGAQTLAELVREVRARGLGPIAVFPEATTTNGRGLARFTPVLDSLSALSSGAAARGRTAGAAAAAAAEAGLPQVHVLSLRYEWGEYCPAYTVGGKLSHVIGLAAQWVNYLEVRVLAPDEARAAVEAAATSTAGGLTAAVAGLVGQVTRLRMTGLSVRDKREFFDYYAEREGGKAKRK